MGTVYEALDHIRETATSERDKGTFYRFTISDLLYFYPRVIYLDCDLVVNCDIVEIIPANLGDHLVAAVPNGGSSYSI